MLKYTIVFTLLFIQLNAAFATQSFRLLARSSTARTAIFNYGSLDGLAVGDQVVILKNLAQKEKSDFDAHQFAIIARARVIKVLDNRSIWLLDKLFRKNDLVIGDVFFMETNRNMLEGRQDYQVKRKMLVGKEGEQAKLIKDYYRGYSKDRLIKREGEYEVTQELEAPKRLYDVEFEVVDIAHYEQLGGEKFQRVQDQVLSKVSFKPTVVYSGPYQEEFLKQINLDTYEKMLFNLMVKVNHPDFKYDTLYYSQKQHKDIPDMREAGLDESIAVEMRDAENAKRQKDREYYRRLLAKGEAWSDDYSDQELNRLIEEKGIMDEQRRRSLILSKKYAYQFFFSTGINMANNETPVDPVNTEQVKMSFAGSLEYDLSKRYASLQNFTSEGELRFSNDGYAIEDTNASAFEVSLSGYLNWYPFIPPNAVEENLFFIGLGFRYGRTKLTVQSLGEQGLYATSSLPVIRGGVKYNFRNQFGLRVMMSYEELSLARIERNIVNVLPENLSATDIRLSASVAYYF